MAVLLSRTSDDDDELRSFRQLELFAYHLNDLAQFPVLKKWPLWESVHLDDGSSKVELARSRRSTKKRLKLTSYLSTSTIRYRNWRMLLPFILLPLFFGSLVIPIAQFCEGSQLLASTTTSPSAVKLNKEKSPFGANSSTRTSTGTSTSKNGIMLHPLTQYNYYNTNSIAIATIQINNDNNSNTNNNNNDLAVVSVVAAGSSFVEDESWPEGRSRTKKKLVVVENSKANEPEQLSLTSSTNEKKAMSSSGLGSDITVITRQVVNHSTLSPMILSNWPAEREKEHHERSDEQTRDKQDGREENEWKDEEEADDYNDYGAYIIYDQATNNNNNNTGLSSSSFVSLVVPPTQAVSKPGSVFFAAKAPYKLNVETTSISVGGLSLGEEQRQPQQLAAGTGASGCDEQQQSSERSLASRTLFELPSRAASDVSKLHQTMSWSSSRRRNGRSDAVTSKFVLQEAAEEEDEDEEEDEVEPGTETETETEPEDGEREEVMPAQSSHPIDSGGQIRVRVVGEAEMNYEDSSGKTRSNRSRRHQRAKLDTQQAALNFRPPTLETVRAGSGKEADTSIPLPKDSSRPVNGTVNSSEQLKRAAEAADLPEQLDKDDIKWLSEMSRQSEELAASNSFGFSSSSSLAGQFSPVDSNYLPKAREAQTKTQAQNKHQLSLRVDSQYDQLKHPPEIAASFLKKKKKKKKEEGEQQKPEPELELELNNNDNNNNNNNNHNNGTHEGPISSKTKGRRLATNYSSTSLNDANVDLDDASDESQPQPEAHNVYYWRLICFILPVGATFGNLLVIMAVYRERSLQSVTNYFIVSLAFADLFVGLVVMPFAVYVLVNEVWELSDTICDIFVAVDVTSSTASILNLVAISIDRYRAVAYPIAYTAGSSSTIAALTIAGVWLISCAVGAPIIFGLNTTPGRKSSLCILYNSTYIFWSSLASFYIPCIAMIALYWRIFSAIRSRTKKAIQASRPAAPTPSGGGAGGASCRIPANFHHLSSAALGKAIALEAPKSSHTRGAQQRIAPYISQQSQAELAPASGDLKQQEQEHQVCGKQEQQNHHPSITEKREPLAPGSQVSYCSGEACQFRLDQAPYPCQSPDRSALLPPPPPPPSTTTTTTTPHPSVCPLRRRSSRSSQSAEISANSVPALKQQQKQHWEQQQTRERERGRERDRDRDRGQDRDGCSIDGHPSSHEAAATSSSLVAPVPMLPPLHPSRSCSLLFNLELAQVDWCQCNSHPECVTDRALDNTNDTSAGATSVTATPDCPARFISQLSQLRLPHSQFATTIPQSDLDSLMGVVALLVAISKRNQQSSLQQLAGCPNFLKAELLTSCSQKAAPDLVSPSCSLISSSPQSVRITSSTNLSAQQQNITSEMSPSDKSKVRLVKEKELEPLKSKLSSMLLSSIKSAGVQINLFSDHCQLTGKRDSLTSVLVPSDASNSRQLCRCCSRAINPSVNSSSESIAQLTCALSSLICLVEPEEGGVDNHQWNVKLTTLIQNKVDNDTHSSAADNKFLKMSAFCGQIKSSFLTTKTSSILVALDTNKFPANGGTELTWRRPTCQLAHLCSECQVTCVLCAVFSITDAPDQGKTFQSNKTQNQRKMPAELKCSHLSKLLKEEQRSKHPNLSLDSRYLAGSSDLESGDSSDRDQSEDEENTRSASRSSSSSSSSYSTNFRIGGSYNSASSFTGGNFGGCRSDGATETSQNQQHLSSQCCQLPLSCSSCARDERVAPPGGGSSICDSQSEGDSQHNQQLRQYDARRKSCNCSLHVTRPSSCLDSHQLAPCSAHHHITSQHQHQHDDSSIHSLHTSTYEAFEEVAITLSNQQLSQITPAPTIITATTTEAPDDSISPLPSTQRLSKDLYQLSAQADPSVDGNSTNEPKNKSHITQSCKTPNHLNNQQQATGILHNATEKIKRRSMRLSQLIRGRRIPVSINQQQKPTNASLSLEKTNSDDELYSSSLAACVTLNTKTNAQLTSGTSAAIPGCLNNEHAARDLSSSVTTSNKDISKRQHTATASTNDTAQNHSEPQLVKQVATSNLASDIEPLGESFKFKGTVADASTGKTHESHGHLMSAIINLLHIKKDASKNQLAKKRKEGSSQVTASTRHRAGSRRRREKTAARRERKATKTLAIVLGIFLICWTPFFTCNIIDGICIQLDMDCRPGMMVYQVTSWLGYINSCVNPIIYTIFNMEFRRAFKKIICTRPKCCC